MAKRPPSGAPADGIATLERAWANSPHAQVGGFLARGQARPQELPGSEAVLLPLICPNAFSAMGSVGIVDRI